MLVPELRECRNRPGSRSWFPSFANPEIRTPEPRTRNQNPAPSTQNLEPHRSEDVLQPELERSRAVGCGGDPSACRRVDGRARQVEVDRIQQIERLCPEFQRRGTRHFKSLEDRKVHVPLIIPAQNTSARVAEREVCAAPRTRSCRTSDRPSGCRARRHRRDWAAVLPRPCSPRRATHLA